MGLPGFSADATLYRSTGRYFATLKSWGSSIYVEGPNVFAFLCGGLGERCCRAPAASQNVAAFGPLVSCKQGLGCDITTNLCVSNCGGIGQVCCDGPETRAPKWTADGKVYSPNTWNMVEMCREGACERQSHRCFRCGMDDGAPRRPPDAAQATARCIGPNLSCAFDSFGFYTSGTCWACGKAGREPCSWGCEPGLGILKALCQVCGADFQPPCDKGCNPGLGPRQGVCRNCGDQGEMPCDYGCNGGLKPRQGLCAVCGGINQPACDAGCNFGTVLINGFCRQCGYNGQPPCTTGSPCVYPMKVAGGVCRVCGGTGQIPCDVGCNSGLVVKNGLCATPQSPTPENCSSVGSPCVPDSQPGMHCCQNPGAHELCVYGFCKACIPHGEEVPPWGTQVCCTPGEVVVWD